MAKIKINQIGRRLCAAMNLYFRTTMKKIVIVSPAYPYRGGQTMVEAYLFNMLSKLGYDCHTISFTVLYPSVFFPGKTQFEESSFVPFPHKEKIKRVINSVNPFTWIKAAQQINRIKPDAVIFVWWMPFFGPAYFIISRLIKSKIIFLVENFISHENRWFDKASTKITLHKADAFICQSSFVKKQIEEVFKTIPVYQSTLNIYDCFNFNKYSNQSAKDFLGIKTKNVVLFFGLIRPYKGLDKLILSFNLILKKHLETTLLIVGENYESMEKYNQLVEKEKIGDKVLMINKYIANEDMEPYFKAADVVALPYNSATQSGIVMLAYGFRKPVVVTDVGGLKELVVEDETGKVISSNNPLLIAGAVSQILSNASKTDFKNAIEKYVNNVGYKNLEATFKSLLS